MIQWMLTSSVLILLVIAVRGLFKEKMKAKYTYALWLIVLVRLLCPVNFGELSFNLLSLAEEGKNLVEEQREAQESVLPQTEADMLWEQQKAYVELHGIRYVVSENPTEIADYLPDSSDESIRSGEVLPLETDGTVPQAQQQEISGFQLPVINWQKVLPVVWAVGMVVLAVVIVSVNISFSTRLGLFRKEVPAFSRKGQGGRKLPVYLADGITSSCLYGVVRPSIYLNRKEMGEQEERYCIEHEYSHYLQGDMLWSVCRIVCLILHWYNPLVWLAVALSKKDAELACDERTIERLGEEERYSYGHILVELAAKQSRAVQMFSMATLMASDKKEVVERVKAIAIKKQTKIITGLLVVCLLVGIGCFIFTGAAKGEQEDNIQDEPVVTATVIPTEAPVPITASPAPTTKDQADITPVPTMDPALVEFIEKSKEERSRNKLLTYILETNTFPVEGNTIATKLNVRSAAGYDADRIDILSMGTMVVINAVEQDADGNYWYAVSYEQKDSKEIKNGYVNSAYLTEAGAVKEQSESMNKYNSEHVHREGHIMYNKIQVPTSYSYYRHLLENQTYTELSFTDHIKLESTSEIGWLIDLDGDGTKEQLSFYEEEISINGESSLKISGTNPCVWLLDIDTTDGMYEILLEDGTVWIYNGSKLVWVWALDNFYWDGCCAFQGDLREFTRVDEHTISFPNIQYEMEVGTGYVEIGSLRECEVKEYQYRLNERHELITPEGNLVGMAVAMKLAIENEPKVSVCFYQTRDINSEYVEVQINWPMLQSATWSKEDDKWCKVNLTTGQSGWSYIDDESSSWVEWFQKQVNEVPKEPLFSTK